MDDTTLYDVAVIGGGLAGLSLAIQSADKGYSVVLLEKEIYPFHKVCGEYISMESWDFLERLSVPLSTINLPVIKDLQISDAAGKVYNFKLPLGGFGISRHLLDHTLANIAERKGVKVLTGAKVNDIGFEDDQFKIQSHQSTFSSKIVAGSFGKRSNLDIKLNRSFMLDKSNKLNNYIGVKYHVRYPQPKSTISLHNFQNGYCGISNIEEDKCCLCYLTTADNLKKSGNSITTMGQNILGKNPLLRKIFSEAEFLYEQPLTISQINFNRKTKIENHSLMIGDAAGMITPLCGNGMSMALHASKIAFETIDQFLQGRIGRNEMERDYVLKWNKNFEKRLWTGRRVQQLFGGNTSTSLFLKTMNILPALAKFVINSTHGKPF